MNMLPVNEILMWNVDCFVDKDVDDDNDDTPDDDDDDDDDDDSKHVSIISDFLILTFAR